MELDELKKELNQKIVGKPQNHSTDDITALLKKNTQSLVQKLYKNLLLEMYLCIFLTLACGALALIIDQWNYKTFFSVDAVFGLVISIIMLSLTSRIKRLSASDATIRTNLQSIVSIIYQYAWLYIRLGLGLLPLIFGLAFWITYTDPTIVPKPIRWDLFVYLLAALFVFGYASFRFTKWYLRKLYGNYVEQLEAMLNELDEQ
jgi:glucan phosphoethanolaminetransferase (alkaline phosphatase superfamily)